MMKEVSVLDVGGKPYRIIPVEKSCNQVATKNIIHIMPKAGFEPKVLEVEG